MAIFTASFGNAPGNIPGFPPVRSFLDFALAGAIVQGILIGGTSAGAAFALDIEGGFFDRLVASPVSRMAILVGRLGGGVTLAMAQTVLFVAVGVVFGARVEGGVAGRADPAAAGGAAGRRGQRPRDHPRAAHRLGRGGPGHVPPVLRAAVLLVGVLPPRDDDRLVQGAWPTSTRSRTWSRRCATRSSTGVEPRPTLIGLGVRRLAIARCGRSSAPAPAGGYLAPPRTPAGRRRPRDGLLHAVEPGRSPGAA